ncbi:NUDIX hydrolase [Burkholderia cenocepacia]|uniref:NUDIX hydrolase n=1 Tax=Burkholderia cenocepacia TaxID=95486 RepID=UPI00209DAA34|nr:NUDIX hydrolase [Burkholderia cenocepacia]MCO8327678.1 NUDIX domain-containing protein [Burkholderia cenocepacia]MCO8334965.1 NUDIX domain-containing protein [Burkholderia cenocepacia]MCO8342247.1 NUDIX domain-containing protein [Burkholderia cenocepacia]MCO8349534.1 NUDIX domain-containing protein [Burkholderia cenocepacia]MCO8362818.1 NUDIX domain-containing protein [Burkholderia cenocepacia]
MSSQETLDVPVKERATVVCLQGQRVLLVARAASRWALPGGTIKAGETPLDAAHRELWEETGLAGLDLTYAMHFGGLSKLHHVFIGELGADLKPQASNEIARCRLVRHDAVAKLRASIPTKKIIELTYSREWSA